MKFIISFLLVSLVTCKFPEDANRIEVGEGNIQGKAEDIYIRLNGQHRDNGEEVYMQVNLNVNINEGNVMVNGQTLPFSELQTLVVEAQICEIKEDGVQSDFEGATVTVQFFLHEVTQAEQGEVTRAFRLETQVKETDKYDVHMFNVTEVVMELNSASEEVHRTVTIISESESKIHAAQRCPMFKCAPLLGCAARKRDENGCQTCECAAMMTAPEPAPELPRCPLMQCRMYCETYKKNERGCNTCECDFEEHTPTTIASSSSSGRVLVIDIFGPIIDHDNDGIEDDSPFSVINCDFGKKLVHKFEDLPFPIRIATIVLLGLIAAILTASCVITVCCRKPKRANKTQNLKAFGFGKLSIYVPDNEKKQPLIDNLDVVSADIA